MRPPSPSRTAVSTRDALASTSGVEAGQPIYVSDSSFDYLSVPPDRCDGLPVDSVRDGYPLELAGLDDAPRIEVEVWLDVSFAITG